MHAQVNISENFITLQTENVVFNVRFIVNIKLSNNAIHRIQIVYVVRFVHWLLTTPIETIASKSNNSV